MVRQNQFDVFLAHNSADKPQVRIIANKLREQGLTLLFTSSLKCLLGKDLRINYICNKSCLMTICNGGIRLVELEILMVMLGQKDNGKSKGLTPWLDEEEILAGKLFQDAIQRAISESKSAAIFIGLKGLGAWQELELQTLISQFVRKKSPVIPVLLPEVSEIPDNLLFLQQFNWVKFEHINNNSALYKLVQGIGGGDNDNDTEPPRLPNPFQPLNGRIEKSEQFFNREKELRDIFEILNAGSGVELLGDRQIGKSSILQQIKHLAASALTGKWEPVYLNLQKVHTETEFYESFCEELGIANCTGIDLNRAMRSRRVLLLLDETENLQGNGFTREIRDRLRAFSEDGSLRLVVAACTPLDRLFPDSKENGRTSPFQGICLRVELKPWSKETVRRFVTVKLENTRICFSEEEMEKLWLESQGHPQKLMKACFDIYRQYR